MATTRTTVPSEFKIGESFSWEKTFSDYPAGDGWTLYYYFRGPGTGMDLVSTVDGDTHVINVATTDSDDLSVGQYWYEGRVEKGSESIVVDSGSVNVLADLSSIAVGTSYDGRSDYQQTLDAIDATLKGKATDDQLSYEIGDRQLRRYDISELIELKKHYQKLVNQELRAERKKQGKGILGRSYARFNRPS